MNKNVIRRIAALIPILLTELLSVAFLFTALKPVAAPVVPALQAFSILYVLYIINQDGESVYRMLWMLIILAMPLSGALLYGLFGNRRTGKPLRTRILQSRKALPPLAPAQNALCFEEFEMDARAMQTLAMVARESGYPACRNEKTDFYPLGDDAVAPMLAALESAEKFIYLEYFIIENGMLWREILEILAQKARDGVDVRVMYDDLGSIATCTRTDRAALRSRGIKCIAFNPAVFVRGTINYRSHRKMMIIDGRIAFSGGINLADAYINCGKRPYGHWKDLVYAVRGGAVESFMHMFAEFWNVYSDDKIDPAALRADCAEDTVSDGLALSYADSPVDSYNVTCDLYIDLLDTAVDYIWFYTPYLLLGDSMQAAMIKAARRGVDVRIILPAIPDKRLVYRMSHAYFPKLLTAGVRIFKYTPGFLHAKACLTDDKFCAIGTVNLDFRSLYLSFENNTLFYRASILRDLKADFERTQEKCREVQCDDLPKGAGAWIADRLLRIISPVF